MYVLAKRRGKMSKSTERIEIAVAMRPVDLEKA